MLRGEETKVHQGTRQANEEVILKVDPSIPADPADISCGGVSRTNHPAEPFLIPDLQNQMQSEIIAFF